MNLIPALLSCKVDDHKLNKGGMREASAVYRWAQSETGGYNASGVTTQNSTAKRPAYLHSGSASAMLSLQPSTGGRGLQTVLFECNLKTFDHTNAKFDK